MSYRRWGTHAAVVFAYLVVAVCFWWPLPLVLGAGLPGDPSGDTGVYVWNLWVFRHELVANQHLPFVTSEILRLDGEPAVSLIRHNFTTVANIVALPLIERIGVVATFNVLTIASVIASAYAMFLFAWRRTGDAVAAFVGGLLFGFSPYMIARSMEHFSLVQAAPLPIFGMLMLEIFQRPRTRTAAFAGLTVAWAYLSDPYYGVYCLLIAMFTIGYSVVTVETRAPSVQRQWIPSVLTLAIFCVAGLIGGILLSGGGRFEMFGVRLSIRRLYTPVLVLTVLIAVRLWIAARANLRWRMPFGRMHLRAAGVAVVACLFCLAPVLYAMAQPAAGSPWRGPGAPWRSSAPGVDAAAWIVPNPLHPLFGERSSSWLATLPNGYVENVASIPWVAIGTIAAACVFAGFRGTRGWWAFAALFATASLGPFVHIDGINTFVPTPWTFLRYIPIVGAARMPTRLTILVVMAVAMLLAMALAHVRAVSRRRSAVTVACTVLLLFELLPAPRRVFSAEVPAVYRTIAADRRDFRVLNLPFGLRDGLDERGAYSTAYQYFQTVYEKPMVGGYISRLPDGTFERYRKYPLVRVLLRLSARRKVSPELMASALEDAPGFMQRNRVGYIVVDTTRTSPELLSFAVKALSLTWVQTDGEWQLYRAPGW